MADMMASGQVGLLLSPKFKLWAAILFTCLPHRWDQGLFDYIFLLFHVVRQSD
jgi:hypothetical protein